MTATDIMSPGAGVIPEWDLGDRLRKSLRQSVYGVQDMADYLSVSRTSVGGWMGGRSRPNPATLRLWALRTNVPYEWLTGQSPS